MDTQVTAPVATDGIETLQCSRWYVLLRVVTAPVATDGIETRNPTESATARVASRHPSPRMALRRISHRNGDLNSHGHGTRRHGWH